MKIPEQLLSDIKGYCEANKLDLDDYIISALRQGHTVLKYGGKATVRIEPQPVVVEVTVATPIEVEKPKIQEVIPTTNNNEIDIYQEN